MEHSRPVVHILAGQSGALGSILRAQVGVLSSLSRKLQAWQIRPDSFHILTNHTRVRHYKTFCVM